MRACEAGVSVSKVALEHGLNTNLLFRWRRQYRAGHFGAVESPIPACVPGVKLLPVMSADLTAKPKATKARMPVIEIVLGEATIRLCDGVDAQAFRTVLDCLANRQ